jgi:4-amino-4-deoxy-L-arabinose transferase-like glycosyltransferase
MRTSFASVQKWFDKRPMVDWVGVFAALGLFTALAWPTMVGASAYFDEGYSAYLARFNPFSTAFYTAFDVHPPLYYVVLHFWQSLVGTDVAASRLLSVVFAWVVVVFAYLIVRRWFNRRSALLAIFLIVLSPLFIRYGTAMRMYTMALAIAFAATYVLLRATTEKSGRWWKIYTALVAIGMWTNYFTAFVWVTHALWIYLYHRHDAQLFKKARRAFIWALIFYVPWLPVLLVRVAVVQAYGFWIPPLSIETFASTITESFVFRSASDTIAWTGVGIIILIAGIATLAHNANRRLDNKSKPALRLLTLLSVVPIVLLIAISLPPLRSAYTFRYVLIATISSTLLIAIILTNARLKRFDRQLRGLLAIVAFALLIVGANQTLASGNRSLDTNWQNRTKQIMEKVHASGKPATVVDRSAYAYYVVRLYPADGYPVKVFYTTDEEMVRGATRPLVDHKDESITNFDGLTKVWLVGDNLNEVSKPSGSGWVQKQVFYENDSYTNTMSEAAIYYER